MPHLNNQQLSTLRARQNAGGGAAGLAAPIANVLGPTAVPVNGSVPAALATPNLPPASPQASGLVTDQQSVLADRVPPLAQPDVALPPQASPVAQAFRPIAARLGGPANVGGVPAPAVAGPAPASSRGTAFGRQFSDGINPTSLF